MKWRNAQRVCVRKGLMWNYMYCLIQGKTLIVIAHRLSTIADADRIFVVEDGRIAEEGTHEQLLENGKLYSKMWKSYIGVKDMGGEAYA